MNRTIKRGSRVCFRNCPQVRGNVESICYSNKLEPINVIFDNGKKLRMTASELRLI